MNWITSVLTSNQWTVVWLGVALVVSLALYSRWVYESEPGEKGRWNPAPAICMGGISTIALWLVFIVTGYLIDGLIWMWNN